MSNAVRSLLLCTGGVGTGAMPIPVKKAGNARMGELVRVMREVRKRRSRGHRVRFSWVTGKAHVGIPGNERANERAKFFTKVVGSDVFTEGRIRQQLIARRKA